MTRLKALATAPLAVLAAGGALVGYAVSHLVPSQYEVTATFVADSKDPMRNLGALAGIAAQLGAGMPLGNAQSPQFFADVLRSREVLRDVLDTPWPRVADSSHGAHARVADYFAPYAGDSLAQLSKALKRVRKRLSTAVGARSGIIDVRFVTRDPEVGVAFVRELLGALDRFNRDTKRTQARERREFTESRLGEARDSLRAAEGALRHFLETNRAYRDAPALMLQADVIRRRISAQQEVVDMLRREFETARLDEVNDTPVLTVLDTPALPARRVFPSRILFAALGALLGTLGWLWPTLVPPEVARGLRRRLFASGVRARETPATRGD